ncbi:hypothetical protein OA081_00460 [Gammaproteobacteria bacterium]|nr:hypothetical protein [Gammaproteobacteria bacterium]
MAKEKYIPIGPWQLKNMPHLSPEDLATIDFFTRRGSQVDKRPNRVSMRTTERLTWGIDILRRKTKNFMASDAQILESIFWNSVREEDPIQQYHKASQNLQNNTSIMKYFIEEKIKTGKANEDQYKFKFTSLIELTWNHFYIFRILKLSLLDEELLTENESKFLEIIKKDKKNFFQENRDDSKVYVPKAWTLATVFEKWDGKLKDEKKIIELLKREDFEKIELNKMIIDRLNLSKEGSLREKKQIDAVIEQNYFPDNYLFGNNRNLRDMLNLEIEYFPLEYVRLLSLKDKISDVIKKKD